MLKPFVFLFIIIAICSCSHKDHDHGEDDADHAEIQSGNITISHEQEQTFGIASETVSAAPFKDVIKTSGVIKAANADSYIITAKKNGIVTLNPDISINSEVSGGYRIGSISSQGVQGGDIQKAAAANLNTAKAEYQRLKPLYEDGLITASVYREAERAYLEAEALAGSMPSSSAVTLTAPFAGSVSDIFVTIGDYVDVGSPIAMISKNTSQVLQADMPLRFAAHLHEIESANFIPEGQHIVLSTDSLKGKKITGQVAAASNGYIPVSFSFSGNSNTFTGGVAEVYLVCGERDNVISVPRSALLEIQGNKYAYIETGDHTFEKRLVRTGADNGRRVEILEGISSGEKVVVNGASVIRMAEISAVAPPSHTHNH